VRAAEHAPRGRFYLLERRHGLAEIVERGAPVSVERLRVIPPHPERESVSFPAGTITRLKEALATRPGVQCAIMLDTKGPEIRTGFFDPSVGDKLQLKHGSTLILTTDYDHKSTGEKLGCTYAKLPTSVHAGNQILVADGSLVLEVQKVLNDKEVACTVMAP
jgi:pyruvate kinase